MPRPGHLPLFSIVWTRKITLLLVFSNIAVYVGLGLLDIRAFESLSHDSFLIDWGANVPPLTLASILQSPDELSTAVVQASGCPYLSCRR